MPATHRDRLRPCDIETQDFADFSGRGLYSNRGGILLDGRLLHDHRMDSNSVSGWLLGLAVATQPYKGRPCGIKTKEFALFCGGALR